MYDTAFTPISSSDAPADLADFRSDTVTRPDAGMMAAIQAAALGDDVYGDDPTTNALEAKAADLLGKEAGLFLPTGTQSNLIAVMAHCERGDEYIIGKTYHIYSYEAGGTAVLGSVFPCPLPVDDRGGLNASDIIAAIKPDDFHTAISRLLCVENTTNGMVHGQDYMDEMASVAHDHGLNAHCDGARLMNAVVALDASAKTLVRGYDSISLCLSKGLGTPAGSVLVGDDAFIKKARRLRKMLGGGMRQTGVLAAAGIYALDHNVARLAEDHQRTKRLAERLAAINGLTINLNQIESNMVFIEFGDADTSISDEALSHLKAFMADHGCRVSPNRRMRCVIHRDIDDAACDQLATGLSAFIDRYAD